jgi:hypothetical protein
MKQCRTFRTWNDQNYDLGCLRYKGASSWNCPAIVFYKTSLHEFILIVRCDTVVWTLCEYAGASSVLQHLVGNAELCIWSMVQAIIWFVSFVHINIWYDCGIFIFLNNVHMVGAVDSGWWRNQNANIMKHQIPSESAGCVQFDSFTMNYANVCILNNWIGEVRICWCISGIAATCRKHEHVKGIHIPSCIHVYRSYT